jgi:hypothetical protein
VPLPQQVLNIEERARTNPFPWRGQFSPQLIEALIASYAPNHGSILDPFVGSGTTLHEAGRAGHPATGVEINPAAAYIARVYTLINCTLEERLSIISESGKSLRQSIIESLPLFARARTRLANDSFFSVRNVARQTKDDYQQILLSALLILVDPHSDSNQILFRWMQLCQAVQSLPYSPLPIRVNLTDARSLQVPDSSIDFVIASPPYINVFNYHQNYRLAAESLGWSLLDVARSEIGSNRKYRQNRFLTVIQYCLDIAAVLSEVRRACKPGARLIFIVGKESNVRKTPFFNGDIFTSIATRCAGLQLSLKQQRVFTNRFGRCIYEDILHFENGAICDEQLDDPKTIASEALMEARARAPRESQTDLARALQAIHSVEPSPFFQPTVAKKRVAVS